MTNLVTLEMARDHLRSDTTDDDNDLTLKIEAASTAVIKYLKGGAEVLGLDSNGDVQVDSDGDPVGVPRDIQLATLMLVGVFYRDREGQDTSKWQQGYLPAAVVSLLTGYRDPALE